MHALTLRDRAEGKRAKWLTGGFQRMHTRPGSLLKYWQARIADDPEAAALSEKVWTEYQNRPESAEKGTASFARKANKPWLSTGPGSQLKRLLGKIGIRPAPGCQCNKRAAIMDAHGPDWCETHIEEIVGWLREEAERAHLPFADFAGRMLVRKAIKMARAAQTDGQTSQPRQPAINAPLIP